MVTIGWSQELDGEAWPVTRYLQACLDVNRRATLPAWVQERDNAERLVALREQLERKGVA
jgi:hypothetical protein